MTAVNPLHAEDIEEFHVPAPVAEPPQPDPVATVMRAMRGRWKATICGGALLGGLFSSFGYFAGVELYESRAILRVYPQESNILYATGDESVLKTFDSFVKAETGFIASHQVMVEAAQALSDIRPVLADGLRAKDLAGSIEIKRSDSLIVLKTLSRDAAFASEKLRALIDAYFSLKAEAEDVRTSVRLSELRERESILKSRLAALRADQLDIGGEYGLNALAKAHVEKIAQVNALALRKSEFEAMLSAADAQAAGQSMEKGDETILRAILLDRAMADLNFERAKLLSELASLRVGFEGKTNLRFRRNEQRKLEEIAVIETAMAERRAQIRILGQTGTLTDGSGGQTEESADQLKNKVARVSAQLDAAKREARDLNRRRIELDRVEHEIDEAENLLKETTRALEVIRLESGRALPGYAVLMSPPSRPIDPSEDTRKMMMVAGMFGGGLLVLLITLTRAFWEPRIRFAETLMLAKERLPVLHVSEATEDDAHAADLLRNELQLQKLKGPRLVSDTPIIVVTRVSEGDTGKFASALANSFARSQLETLYINADTERPSADDTVPGWREALCGAQIEPNAVLSNDSLWEMGAGSSAAIDDSAISAPRVRSAINDLRTPFDVIIISAGVLRRDRPAQFLLSNADVGVLAVTPSDKRALVFDQINRLDELPRHGSVAVMRSALAGDPWLPVRT